MTYVRNFVSSKHTPQLTIVKATGLQSEIFEIFARSLGHLLSMQVAQKNWTNHLDFLVFALNTTISNTTKYTPFEIVFGGNPVLPIDMYFGTCDVFDGLASGSTKDYVNNLRNHLQNLYESVRTHLNVSRGKMKKKQYDTNVNYQDLKIGDKVLEKTVDIGESRKLSPRKTGPWSILNKMPNGVTFLIENGSTGKRQVVHHDRIEKMTFDDINTEPNPELV